MGTTKLKNVLPQVVQAGLLANEQGGSLYMIICSDRLQITVYLKYSHKIIILLILHYPLVLSFYTMMAKAINNKQNNFGIPFLDCMVEP